MDEVIKQAIGYVSNYFKNDCSGHDVFHTMRVYKMAERIAEQENADEFIVQLAALLHDVDDSKLSPTTYNEKKNAVDFMRSQGVRDDIVKRVLTVIEEISYKGTETVEPTSVESKCVQDADRLDAMGAIGIARAFAYGGSSNRIMYDPEIEPRLNMDERQYTTYTSTTINHFYEKLFLLKDMMNTQTAKKLAEQRGEAMKHFLKLTDYTKTELFDIFHIADELRQGKYRGFLNGKTVVMFFPNNSIRTRVTFEKGIALLGGQAILFPTDTLDKKEELKDVCGYLNQWADMLIVRHRNFSVMEEMAQYSEVPIINGLSDINHPCEMMGDMYALSKCRKDFTKDKYLFCGINANVGLAWKEASQVMGFDLSQCCGQGFEILGVSCYYRISEAVVGKDIICTDSLPREALKDFANCQVTSEAMRLANDGAILNPCPPFYRGEEVSAEVMESEYFVGYEFKKYLLEVQQAIMIYCMLA